MKQKKKLISYNSEKSPIVNQFFESIDKGMQSHYMRKAIEFYVKYNKEIIKTIKEDNKSITSVKNIKNNKNLKSFDDKFLESILWYISKYK